MIFGLCGYYFLRLFLWNKHGKEIIYLEKNRVSYEADYKMFKANKVEISDEELTIEIKPVISNNKLAILKINTESQQIETVVKAPIEKLEALQTEIKSVYNE